ncbi:hypothetical protein WA026_020920 [Henosepilachna vigintioctopunctata]|uniref:G-protein coupled receptors family 1 profile domain-containing protein n=1 Tax=Henosepilachna vigintioctopunctata TaxID=420089 RepID=A0AAW1UI91_9CUCU
MDNSTFGSIKDTQNDKSDPEYIVRLILCFTCVTAVIVNLKVFACIYWIRRPLNSVLKISLSLALADSCASCLSAVSIFSEDIITDRTFIILDLIRLNFILVTHFHLLGLGFNHYIGIRKPLLHNSRLTQNGISWLLILLWLVPTVFTIALYTVEGGTKFWRAMFEDNLIEKNDTITYFRSLIYENQTSEKNDNLTIYEEYNHTIFIYSHVKFIETFRFRMTVGSFIVVCILLIVIFYICILVIIRRQRKVWKDLSRTGSTVWKGHNCRYASREKNQEQSKIKGNFRAVYTTLLIVGSCLIGWLPALLLYTLACSQDCFISGTVLKEINEKYHWHTVMIRFFDNEMLFLKMIANPIIYSIRMKEIKEGTRQMHNGLMRRLCGRQCTGNRDQNSKINNSTQSHVALTSIKLEKNGKGSQNRRKYRRSSRTSYL